MYILIGSSYGSSPVAVGSSPVAIGIGQKGTATNKYILKSTSYKKVAVVAVDLIKGQKIQFSPLFCYFLTIKKVLVAVDFLYKIFLFQVVIIDKKCNCYHWPERIKPYWFQAITLSLIGIGSPFNCQKNRLLLVIYYLLFIRLIGLIDKGLMISVLGFYCESSVTWKENSGKSGMKSGISIAHNYKKCDKGIYRLNKINKLQIVNIKKSVVQIETDGCLLRVLRSETHPPIENSGRQASLFYLLLFLNCKDFQRGFSKGLGQSFVQRDVFGFRKVGGAGGVF